MTRAFFIECSGSHWIGIGQRLAERHGVVPVLWTGDRATIAQAMRIFPGIVTSLGVDATCGRFTPPVDRPLSTLDGEMLRALAPDESIALTMMDRMDLGPGRFDHDARKRHWHVLLRTWAAALDALNPDIVIFSIAPHQIYDYALYALCKFRNIPTRMFERTALPGLVFILSRFEDGSPQLQAMLKRKGFATPLSARAKTHIAGLRGEGEGTLPPNYRKKLAKRGLLRAGGRQANASLLQIAAFEFWRALYLLLRKKGPPDNYHVCENGEGKLVSPGVFGWLAGRWRGQWRKWKLRRLVQNVARPVDKSRPYILLALHFQPERAIVPMAGSYGDQNLIVDMLANCLPKGWLLVVKEHPWQLVPFSRGELSRSAAFYRRIVEHRNVVLAPQDADTQTLLADARAVATATGSVGWQAIARGIPALVFGAAWYRDSQGAFPVRDTASCEQAMTTIEKGIGLPSDAAERMLGAIEAVAVRGYLEPGLEATEGLGESDAVEAMSAALATSFKAVEEMASVKEA